MDITVRELAGQISPLTWVLVGLAVSYVVGGILIRSYVQTHLDNSDYWKEGFLGLRFDSVAMFLGSPVTVPMMLVWKLFSFRKEV